MRQLVGQDATFLHVETATIKTHFTILTIYDQSGVPGGVLRYRDILQYFDQRLTPLPVFRRKLVNVPFNLDAPYWVDDPAYHIESHVRHIGLPRPGDWRQFCILVGQIQAANMDISKPLWDMHVVEGLDNIEGLPPDSFAILTRLHHAIADGTTARGIMMALHQPAGQKMPRPPVGVREPVPTMSEMAVRAVVNNATRFVKLEARLIRALPYLGEALIPMAGKALSRFSSGERSGDLLGAIAPAPATIFNQEMDYRRVFQLRMFPLSDIIAMRKAVDGATVNDVVLTLVGEGLRRYLARMKKSVKADLQAICPINIRSDKLSNDSLAGNDISLMRTNLRTTQDDLLERMRDIAAGTKRSKETQNAAPVKELIAIGKEAPNLLLALGSRIAVQATLRSSSKRPLSNCIITNVPGPQEPLYFMGAKLVLFSGSPPSSPLTGPTIPVTSYDGKLFISFSGAASWIKDPQGLAECLTEAFDAMCEQVLPHARRAIETEGKKTKAKKPARRSAKKQRVSKAAGKPARNRGAPSARRKSTVAGKSSRGLASKAGSRGGRKRPA